jgi:Ser/Thr protein kinase RdoA (MazF antagonist)
MIKCMKDFYELHDQEKARRLRFLALDALHHYDLDIADPCHDVQHLKTATNTHFSVQTTDSARYVLRVCRPGWRTATDLTSEVMWLQALDRDTDIGAPVPVLTWRGEPFIEATAEGVPEPRRCMMMTQLPGTPLGQHLTVAYLMEMGELFARMHIHARDFAPPPGFTELKMDRVLARGEPNELFSETSADAFTPESREIIERVWTQVHAAFERRYADPNGLRVIHNDLWHDNIMVDEGRLRPLDFEDTAWGYPVQDIAMALNDLSGAVEHDRFESLRKAFRTGYERRATWPEAYEGEIDAFRVGRMLWVANYVARYERPHLRRHLDGLSDRLKVYLKTGKL